MALKIRTIFMYVLISILFVSIHHIFSPPPSFSIITGKPPYDAVSIQFDPGTIVQLKPHITHNQNIPTEIEPTVSSTFTRIDEIKPSNDAVSIQLDSGAITHNRGIPIEIEGTVSSNSTNLTRFVEFERSDCENCESISAIRITITNVAVLFPAWEVLVIVSELPEIGIGTNYTSNYCLFDTNEITPARFSGTLMNPNRKTYTCKLPKRARRKLPFRQPELVKLPEKVKYSQLSSPLPELLRWSYIVYDIVETENDIVLLAKGINNRQGVNRSPTEFKCVFGDNTVNGVTTAVTSSNQEVFRCQRPNLTSVSQSLLKASLLIQTNQLVPSIAYYSQKHKIANDSTKSLLCACTMVYNVAKFLKEWVIYHSKIGIDKFILYDNNSDDDFDKVVNRLKSTGYVIETRFWLWPKTQEAGFSHSVLLAKNSCKWMMYIDIDEFVYSPLWKSSKPSKSLLHSILPKYPYGQLTIRCYEFGPSNQKTHPLTGVTQGYNCRKKAENRHKSIILLDAVHESLENAIHHFRLKDGYKSAKMELEKMVVNHYKFQVWDEFRAKFRRRVSAYVVDWTQTVNMKSNDRAPGLGYMAVEPEGWEQRFCEVYDNRLRDLTRRWFGSRIGRAEIRMDWQD